MLGENSHNLAIPGLATEIPALATGANAGQKRVNFELVANPGQ